MSFDALELATAKRLKDAMRDPPPLRVEDYAMLFRRFPILVKAWGRPDEPLTRAERDEVIAGQMVHQNMASAAWALKNAGLTHPLAGAWGMNGDAQGIVVPRATAEELQAIASAVPPTETE